MKLQPQWSRYLPNTLLAFVLIAALMGCGRSEESANSAETAGEVTTIEALEVDNNTQATPASVPTPLGSGNDVAPPDGQTPSVSSSQNVAGADVITPNNSMAPGGMAGGPTMPDMPENDASVLADQNTLLAAALGISIEDLQTERQRALEAAMPQLPSAGNTMPPRANARGDFGNGNSAMQSALAAQLGISVEELQSADTAAWRTALTQAVADGRLTQEEADAIATRMTPPE